MIDRSSVKGTVCKIGGYNYMRSLINSGLVYMNTLKAFWDIEDECVRGDSLDSVHTMANGSYGEVRTTTGSLIPVKVNNWTMQTRPSAPHKINLYCMYALRWDDDAPEFDSRICEFGDTAILFRDANKFMDRLFSAIREQGYDLSADLVTYVPTDYVGEVGPFVKRDPYSYQSEWRVKSGPGPGRPVTLELGPLCDIADLVPTTKLPVCVSHLRSSGLG